MPGAVVSVVLISRKSLKLYSVVLLLISNNNNNIDEGLTNRILKFADDTKLFGVVTN